MREKGNDLDRDAVNGIVCLSSSRARASVNRSKVAKMNRDIAMRPHCQAKMKATRQRLRYCRLCGARRPLRSTPLGKNSLVVKSVEHGDAAESSIWTRRLW